jgi:hypothetical protein
VVFLMSVQKTGSQNWKIRYKLRSDTAADWSTDNPILLEGEPGYETDTHRYKIGDGVHRWSELDAFIAEAALLNLIRAAIREIDYGGEGSAQAALADHINSSVPHPVYDDGPSLLLLYENAKV